MRRTASPSRPYGRYAVGLRPSLDPDAYFDAPNQDQEAPKQAKANAAVVLTGLAPSGMTCGNVPWSILIFTTSSLVLQHVSCRISPCAAWDLSVLGGWVATVLIKQCKPVAAHPRPLATWGGSVLTPGTPRVDFFAVTRSIRQVCVPLRAANYRAIVFRWHRRPPPCERASSFYKGGAQWFSGS
jgi:hypothetical protein